MKNALVVLAVMSAVLVACNGNAPPTPPKVDSPTVDLLSATQLEGVATACLKYPTMDDARVPYTERYCSLALKERDARALQSLKPQEDKNRSLLMLGKDKH